jgi:hypothetical protein
MSAALESLELQTPKERRAGNTQVIDKYDFT